MLFSAAQELLNQILAPHSYERFFNEIVGRQPLALLGGNCPQRASIIGPDPKNVLLAEFEKYASSLTCHIHTPKSPPPSPRNVTSSKEFHALVKEYHTKGYTVRIPEVLDLSPELSQFTRALEVVLEKPVGVVIFWSDTGAAAPIHHDEIDVIVIQLTGSKRWFISKETASMPNQWKGVGEGPPLLGEYDTYDVQPGDLLYVPRGTAHTVQSTSESIHLSIGFVPVTVRDSLNAVLDHFSDLHRPLRLDAGKRADNLAQNKHSATTFSQVRQSLELLLEQCQSDEFIERALTKRSARMVHALPKYSEKNSPHVTQVNTWVGHHALSISQLLTAPNILDLRLPSEIILIHPGAQLSLQFMLENSKFKVADIPGEIADDVRIALVNRLIAAGFLLVLHDNSSCTYDKK